MSYICDFKIVSAVLNMIKMLKLSFVGAKKKTPDVANNFYCSFWPQFFVDVSKFCKLALAVSVGNNTGSYVHISFSSSFFFFSVFDTESGVKED